MKNWGVKLREDIYSKREFKFLSTELKIMQMSVFFK